MASLNLQNPTQAGIAQSEAAAAAGGDSFPLADGILLRVRLAASGASRTVTIVGQNPCNFGVTHSNAVVCPDNATTIIFIPGTNQFRDANNRVQLTYSAVTNMFVSATPA